MLKAGDKAPTFKLASEHGDVKSSDLKGKRYVLYFYPSDDTPGCTKEACSFRDNLPKFTQAAVPIYGVSPQDVASKKKFSAKYSLNFPLLADAEHAVAEAFGAWGEKMNYGKKYMGIIRSSFLIGEDGRIEHAWYKVSPKDTVPNAQAALAG